MNKFFLELPNFLAILEKKRIKISIHTMINFKLEAHWPHHQKNNKINKFKQSYINLHSIHSNKRPMGQITHLKKEDFKISTMNYIKYFVIISPWDRAWPFF